MDHPAAVFSTESADQMLAGVEVAAAALSATVMSASPLQTVSTATSLVNVMDAVPPVAEVDRETVVDDLEPDVRRDQGGKTMAIQWCREDLERRRRS